MTNQQRIAREFFGWRQSANFSVFWRAPGDRGDAPTRRLPNLKTEVGAAVWAVLIKRELTRRGLWFSVFTWEDGSVDFAVYRAGDNLTEKKGATELAALTAAVLALMESEK